MTVAGFLQFRGREWLIVWTRPPRQPKLAKLAKLAKPELDYWRQQMDYWRARKEHAWLLRCEGLTLRQVGLRLGIGPNRAQQLIWTFGRRMSRALLHARWQLR